MAPPIKERIPKPIAPHLRELPYSSVVISSSTAFSISGVDCRASRIPNVHHVSRGIHCSMLHILPDTNTQVVAWCTEIQTSNP
eukprot:3605315-Pyramimonas_sp.AAC.2